MAKIFSKREAEASREAAVSSIPVPPADSALVIDLPEGQKLVLGKMEEGTVIEVATWRGTGRPDSRTNRLMLGVSFGTQNPTESTDSDTSEPTTGIAKYRASINSLVDQVVSIAKSISKRFVSLISELAARKGGKVRSRGDVAEQEASFNKVGRKSVESAEEFDVDSWLESVRSKSRIRQLESSSSPKPVARKGEARPETKKSVTKSSPRKAAPKRSKGKK